MRWCDMSSPTLQRVNALDGTPATARVDRDAALVEAQRRGDVGVSCEPETVAQFLVAALEGAILMTKVTKDITVLESCVGEVGRYLTLYETKR